MVDHQDQKPFVEDGPKQASAFGEMLIKMDMFPRRLHLHFPSGKDKYQSVWGASFSILLWVIVLVYTIMVFGSSND